jgi:sn-glycerol 3-phosphate transport system substrate-binding protein
MEAAGESTDDYLQAAIDFYTIDGVYWPASTNSSAPLLYYNENHFERAGLDRDSAPTDLDEMREYAQAIKDAGVVDVPIILNLSPAIVEQFLTGGGIQVVDNDNGRGDGQTTESLFDSPETVEFLTWVTEMVDDGLLEVPPPIDNQFDHYLAMAGQTASMTIETSTAATSVEAFLGGELELGDLPDDAAEEAEGQEVDLTGLSFGAAEVPGINGPGQLQFGGGAWYITNTTPPEVQAAAWDFITWFNSLDTQVRWSIEGSYLPYLNEAADDPRLQEEWSSSLAGQWLALAYDELLEGVDPANPGPLLGPYDQFRSAVRDGISALIFDDAAPADVAAEVDETTTAAIETYNEEF